METIKALIEIILFAFLIALSIAATRFVIVNGVDIYRDSKRIERAEQERKQRKAVQEMIDYADMDTKLTVKMYVNTRYFPGV